MPRDRPRDEDDEEEAENFWKGLARDLLVAAIIVVVFLAAIYLYTGVWPPLVVVESASMQHSDQESFLGVIDTGDMVFQQAAPTRADVVTYLEGRATGYATYGDYGDVIIFRRAGNPTPVIHRAIMYITLYANGTASVPDLAGISNWTATGDTGPTTTPFYLRSVTINAMGFRHDFGIRFDFANFGGFGARSGYITMGDNNAPGYDTSWLPRQGDIIGRARGDGGRPPGSRRGLIGRRALGIRNRELEKRGLNFEAVAPGLREDLVLLQDFLHVEGRHGGLDLFRPPAAAERSDASVDEAEHVQLRDEVRDPALRQRGHAGLP